MFDEFTKLSEKLAKDDQSISPPDELKEDFKKLYDISKETLLAREIKDIRDELEIISMILGYQEHLLPELREAVKAVYREERSLGQLRKVDKSFEEQEKTISNPIKYC